MTDLIERLREWAEEMACSDGMLDDVADLNDACDRIEALERENDELKKRERVYVEIIERECHGAVEESLEGNDCMYSADHIGGFKVTFFAGMIEGIEDTRQYSIVKETE